MCGRSLVQAILDMETLCVTDGFGLPCGGASADSEVPQDSIREYSDLRNMARCCLQERSSKKIAPTRIRTMDLHVACTHTSMTRYLYAIGAFAGRFPYYIIRSLRCGASSPCTVYNRNCTLCTSPPPRSRPRRSQRLGAVLSTTPTLPGCGAPCSARA